MGGIDAYTYIEHNAVFASAQTGNMVVFAVKLFNGGFGQAWVNIPVWIGFAIGCFSAQGSLAHFKTGLKGRYYNALSMTLITAMLLICAMFQTVINAVLLIFMLGLLSGFELTMFRTVGIYTVNNGIMTGNTKNLMVSVYQWVFEHDQKARGKCLMTAMILLTFIAGAYSSALVCTKVSAELPLWGVFVLNMGGLITVLIQVPHKSNITIDHEKKLSSNG